MSFKDDATKLLYKIYKFNKNEEKMNKFQGEMSDSGFFSKVSTALKPLSVSIPAMVGIVGGLLITPIGLAGIAGGIIALATSTDLGKYVRHKLSNKFSNSPEENTKQLKKLCANEKTKQEALAQDIVSNKVKIFENIASSIKGEGDFKKNLNSLGTLMALKEIDGIKENDKMQKLIDSKINALKIKVEKGTSEKMLGENHLRIETLNIKANQIDSKINKIEKELALIKQKKESNKPYSERFEKEKLEELSALKEKHKIISEKISNINAESENIESADINSMVENIKNEKAKFYQNLEQKIEDLQHVPKSNGVSEEDVKNLSERRQLMESILDLQSKERFSFFQRSESGLDIEKKLASNVEKIEKINQDCEFKSEKNDKNYSDAPPSYKESQKLQVESNTPPPYEDLQKEQAKKLQIDALAERRNKSPKPTKMVV